MHSNRRTFAVAAFLLLFPGCTCPWGSCRTQDGTTEVRGAGPETAAAGDSADRGTAAPSAIVQNLTDAEILVDEVEPRDGTGYLLRGTILSASPAGGRASIAEAGQRVTLTPLFPGGTPDLSSPAHRRMMDLSGSRRGAKVRCRIALDGAGAWRIVTVE